MSDTTTTTEAKRRGRPKGPRPALTSAERMRQARERVKAALWDLALIADLPDTLLAEASGAAYRSGNPFAIAECARVMLDRLNAATTPEKRLHMAIIYGDESVGRDDPYWLRQTAIDTVTDNKPIEIDTVTNTDNVTITEKESEDTDTVTDTPALGLEPSPPARSDADLVGAPWLKPDTGSTARI